jgi:hypothetical protein
MSGFSLSYSNSQSLYIKDGWFSETEAMWPGQKFCIEVDEVLANGKSKFQVSDDDDDDDDIDMILFNVMTIVLLILNSIMIVLMMNALLLLSQLLHHH